MGLIPRKEKGSFFFFLPKLTECEMRSFMFVHD